MRGRVFGIECYVPGTGRKGRLCCSEGGIESVLWQTIKSVRDGVW